MSEQRRTVSQVLDATARQHGERPAIRHKVDGEWRTITWAEYRETARRVARAFVSLGLQPGKGVAILGFNRPEWFFTDIGAILAGGVPAGIYTTSSVEQARYIVEHCEAQILVVENPDYLELASQIRFSTPGLKAMVLMNGREASALSWEKLLARADKTSEEELDARIEAQGPEDLCTLIYTSGTTGPPKAVMLSHDNLVWTAGVLVREFELGPGDSVISYLPLSHIAEQIITVHGPLAIGATTWFAESLEKMAENLREVRPELFFAVPRVWEKIQAAIGEAAASSGTIKRKIGAWARKVGLAAGYAEQMGEEPPKLQPIAEALVFRKVRERLGLDRARICAVAAAPTALSTHEFFLSLGIPILEVYGQSENTGPATISLPDRYRTGWAGRAMKGTEVDIAEDGEILLRGPHICMGYLKNPEATAETISEDGWLHTGDIGELDENGFLKVTDRKKEILITSGGKNISPQNIEAMLKSIPVIAQAAAIGDGRKYVAALLTIDQDRWRGVAQSIGSPAATIEEAATDRVFHDYVERQVAKVNERLSNVEAVKRFRLSARDFSIEGGELTPTMKLKRRVIAKNYAAEIESLY